MSDPYYDDGAGIQIYHGRCEDILPSFDWGPSDVVASDPPYGTGGWRRIMAGQGGNPTGTLVHEAWDDGDVEWLRLIGTDVVVAFWPPARTRPLLNAAVEVGLTKHRTLYMRKPDPKPLPAGRTRWSVEPIWVLSKDGFVLTGGHDLCEACQPRKGRDRRATGHPYEKPFKVMTWLLAKTSRTRVIDPFMGSGTTLVAAKALGMAAVGIESDKRWCDVAIGRLRQSVLPLEIPA